MGDPFLLKCLFLLTQNGVSLYACDQKKEILINQKMGAPKVSKVFPEFTRSSVRSWWIKMKIEIETTLPLLFVCDDCPNDIKLIRTPQMELRCFEYEFVAIGLLSFSSGVAASVVANWIYEKIKGAKEKPEFKIKISGKKVRKLTIEGITEIIETEIQLRLKG